MRELGIFSREPNADCKTDGGRCQAGNLSKLKWTTSAAPQFPRTVTAHVNNHIGHEIMTATFPVKTLKLNIDTKASKAIARDVKGGLFDSERSA